MSEENATDPPKTQKRKSKEMTEKKREEPASSSSSETGRHGPCVECGKKKGRSWRAHPDQKDRYPRDRETVCNACAMKIKNAREGKGSEKKSEKKLKVQDREEIILGPYPTQETIKSLPWNKEPFSIKDDLPKQTRCSFDDSITSGNNYNYESILWGGGLRISLKTTYLIVKVYKDSIDSPIVSFRQPWSTKKSCTIKKVEMYKCNATDEELRYVIPRVVEELFVKKIPE